MDLVLNHSYNSISDVVKHFIKQVRESDLIFDSRDLFELGVNNHQQLDKAIEGARLSCSFAGLDLNNHFKPYYIDKNGELFQAWRLSKLAFTLCFLKSDVYDMESANLQTIIAGRVSELFFMDELNIRGKNRRGQKDGDNSMFTEHS